MTALPVMTGAGVVVKGGSSVAVSSRIIEAAVGVVPSAGADAPVDADDAVDAVDETADVAAAAGAGRGSTATSSATPRLSPVTAATRRADADAVPVLRAKARRTGVRNSPK